MDLPPLLANKHTNSPSVFIPSTSLRKAKAAEGRAARPPCASSTRTVISCAGFAIQAPQTEAFPGLALLSHGA